MKSMLNKVILGLLVAAFARPPIAEAAYLGTVDREGGYTIEMVAGGNTSWTVTFLSVVRGKLEVRNTMTGAGNSPATIVPVPRSDERAILLIDVRGGSVLVRFTDGAAPLTEVFADVGLDARAVFDFTG